VEVGGAVTLSRLEHFAGYDEAGFKSGKEAYNVNTAIVSASTHKTQAGH
jgi:hypothetical protein